MIPHFSLISQTREKSIIIYKGEGNHRDYLCVGILKFFEKKEKECINKKVELFFENYIIDSLFLFNFTNSIVIYKGEGNRDYLRGNFEIFRKKNEKECINKKVELFFENYIIDSLFLFNFTNSIVIYKGEGNRDYLRGNFEIFRKKNEKECINKKVEFARLEISRSEIQI